MGRNKQLTIFSFVLIALLLINPVIAWAQSHQSSQYRLDEVFIGPGGTSDSNSNSYNLQGNLGDIGAGESSSSSYNLLAGYTTDAEPTILFAVNEAVVDLGVLNPSRTGTGTGSFSVGAYNADGLVVQTLSQPPTNSGATLEPMATTAASSAGTEQFGINLRQNSCPPDASGCSAPFGAEPVQVPDPSFSFATVATGYDTVDQYRYNVGETIAESSQSTGQTDFTISYVANAAPLTEGGEYTMNHILVATATY